MIRITRSLAVFATAAAIAAAGAAPASAAESTASGDAVVCDNNISVKGCGDWAFAVAKRTTDYVEQNVVPIAQGYANVAACLALEVTTGRDCPYWPPPIS